MAKEEKLDDFVTEENKTSKNKVLILQMNQCLARLKKLSERDLDTLSTTDSKALLEIYGKRKSEYDDLYSNLLDCEEFDTIESFTNESFVKETLDYLDEFELSLATNALGQSDANENMASSKLNKT